MEALSVGMFIRTPLGIDKIIYLRIQDEYGCNYDTQLEHNLFLNNERDHISIDGECFEKEEIKTSFNIIDLIEVGDYVNGVMVESMNNSIKPIPIPQYKNECGEYIDFDESDIKSIVTKEMFADAEYRVETN